MTFDFESLKNILACPECHSKLLLDGNRLVCQNESCRLAFEVLEEIPVMLVDEATRLQADEWKTIVEQQSPSAE